MRHRGPGSGAPDPGDGWPAGRLVGPQVTVHRQPVVAPDGAVRGYAVHVSVRTPLTGSRHAVDTDRSSARSTPRSTSAR